MNYNTLTASDFINVARYLSKPLPSRVVLNLDTPDFVCRDPVALPARYRSLTLEVDGEDVEVVIGTDRPPQPLAA